VYLVTKMDNHSPRIVIDPGNVVSMVAGWLNGSVAIVRLRPTCFLRYRLQRDLVVRATADDDPEYRYICWLFRKSCG